MLQIKLRKLNAEIRRQLNSGDVNLIRRVLVEYGRRHWLLYAFGFTEMGIASGCTALSAYLIGTLVNEAYLSRDFTAIVILCFFAVGIFATKGLSTYAQSVLLARVSNKI